MSRPKSIDRSLVLDAAEKIVVERGAGDLTVDAVAKAMGVTKGGIQSCFGTKEKMIAAMMQRWTEMHDEALRTVDADSSLLPVQRHIRVTATADTLNAKSAGLLAALLQSKEQMTGLRDWYAGHFKSFDASTEEGQRARLAFLATEGAFMLRYLGLADIGSSEWSDIFRDIEQSVAPRKGKSPT